MAVVPMTKLRVIGLKSESAKIMETLSRSHCFEAREALFPLSQEDNAPALLSPADNSETVAAMAAKQARAGYAIEYLTKQSDILAGMKKGVAALYDVEPLKKESVRPQISADEFFGIINEEKELSELVAEIDGISFRQNDIKQEIIKLKEDAAVYEPYHCCPYPFSVISETKKTAVMIFSAPKAVRQGEPSGAGQAAPVIYVEHFADAKYKTVAAVCLLSQREEVLKYFNVRGFVSCPFIENYTAAQAIEQSKQKQAALKKESDELFKKALSLLNRLPRLKILYDYYSVKTEQCGSSGIEGNYVMMIEGWCPASAAEKICEEIKENTSCAYLDTKEPEDGETVPTLLKNNSVVSPFEDLTEMYTAVDYRESDPNKFMAFWYFFIFGLMCADVVYGVLITAACLILLKVKKFEKGMTNMLKLFGVCGISSALWGVVFGSFAGFGIEVSESCAFGYKSTADGLHYFGWFNSMEKPIMLFGLSLIVGIAHLAFGYGLKFAENIKNRHPFDAVCEGVFPALILLSLYFLGANIFYGVLTKGVISLSEQFLTPEMSEITGNIGMIMILVGIAGIALTAGRGSLANKKSGIAGRIGGWLGGGLNGVYGLINIISDILSYSRVFGLALSGAAIAYAFNTLVDVVFFGGNIIATIIGVVLLAFLHIFNLALGVLSTYVHNARLQFLEFYGKFLNGDGKSFEPLGETTKYVKF